MKPRRRNPKLANRRAKFSPALILKTGWRPVIFLLALALVLIGATLTSKTIKVEATEQSQGEEQISAAALQQIQSLEDEKESRTPAQRKINSQLLYAAKMHRGEPIAAGVPTMDIDVGADSEGKVTVDISAEYFGYLRRDPEAEGLAFWVDVLNREPNNYRGMVCSFITSAEYQKRFGSVVSHSNRECGQ